MPDVIPVAQTAAPAWHVLWTHSRCEQQVHDQLAAQGLEILLPKLTLWTRSAGARRATRRPMFPGYLFLRHAVDKETYLQVRRARGLVTVLGERWDRLAVVPDAEVESLRALSRSDLPARPYPYLRDGARVRITRGPLADIEGFLAHAQEEKGTLVLSVELLSRSVAVEIDCTAVVPA
jgi:transcriptional antiterminator NusG